MSRKKKLAGYPFVWTRETLPRGRKGHRCRKTGKRYQGNVVSVEFSDGARFTVAEGGLKRAEVS